MSLLAFGSCITKCTFESAFDDLTRVVAFIHIDPISIEFVGIVDVHHSSVKEVGSAFFTNMGLFPLLNSGGMRVFVIASTNSSNLVANAHVVADISSDDGDGRRDNKSSQKEFMNVHFQSSRNIGDILHSPDNIFSNSAAQQSPNTIFGAKSPSLIENLWKERVSAIDVLGILSSIVKSVNHRPLCMEYP
jgi:hypothetical protein